eukprot:Lithocolla_globosa_v1_NODE_58_length_7390_cov_243.140014.p10 type:complete len:106 gc:universal NODE_58_length_7390_cov_243.140014:688-371(-)
MSDIKPKRAYHKGAKDETPDTITTCNVCKTPKPNHEFPFIKKKGLYERRCKVCVLSIRKLNNPKDTVEILQPEQVFIPKPVPQLAKLQKQLEQLKKSGVDISSLV